MGPKNCPKCRLLNPPDATACDCGYQFATGQVKKPTARAKISVAPAQVDEVAASFRSLVTLVGIGFALSLARLLSLRLLREFPNDVAIVNLGVAVGFLVVGIASFLQVRRLAAAIDLERPVLYAVGVLLPVVSIVMLLVLSAKASRWCADRGVPVGLLGPKPR